MTKPTVTFRPGKPDLPVCPSREMVKENLVAERVAIDSYSEMIDYIGDDDLTTRRILEDVLATEEVHAEDLRMLIEALAEDEQESGRTGPIGLSGADGGP